MSDAFIGEIRLFAIYYVPENWLLCDGSQVNVAQYQALYSVIQNVYGGTPGRTFNLPNLLGRACVGAGQGPNLSPYRVGQVGGETTVALTGTQMAAHQHTVQHYGVPYNEKTARPAAGSYIGAFDLSPSSEAKIFVPGSAGPSTTLLANTIGVSGGNADYSTAVHENRQPYEALNFCICWDGVYPIHP
jgi:microcystin-dependent protein